MANTIPVFLANSPSNLPLSREIQWGENLTQYDTGESQGQTAWSRELWRWRVRINNQQDTFISSLVSFVNDRRGRVRPFFWSDPYDFRVNSQQLQNTGTAVVTMELFHPVGSYHVYPNSAFIQTLTSNLSGTLNLGIDFQLDHDTGYITLVVSPTSTDYITVNSTQFWRKARFDRSYSDQSPLWQIFDAEVSWMEIP